MSKMTTRRAPGRPKPAPDKDPEAARRAAEPSSPASPGKAAGGWPLLRLLRPHQWLKNGFVFVGLLFGHAWNDADKLTAALIAFAAFCLLASGVYVLNDLADRERDRQHPKKRLRPLAAGTVTVPAALAAAA